LAMHLSRKLQRHPAGLVTRSVTATLGIIGRVMVTMGGRQSVTKISSGTHPMNTPQQATSRSTGFQPVREAVAMGTSGLETRTTDHAKRGSLGASFAGTVIYAEKEAPNSNQGGRV